MRRSGRVAAVALGLSLVGTAELVGVGGQASATIRAGATIQANATTRAGATLAGTATQARTPIQAVAPAAGRVAVPVLHWTTCSKPYQCAYAAVPLDWSHPQGRKIALALIKAPATDRRHHKLGTVFVNPGGPGGSGVDLVREDPTRLSAAVRARFDVVGFDPRFVGRSRPTANCLSNAAFAAFVAGQPVFPVTADEEDQYATAQAGYTSRCAKHSDLAYASTASVARDLDLLRQAVGDSKLSFAGYSYGSLLGQMYAQLFPTKVRAMVLDGVVDAQAWARGDGMQWRYEPFSARLGSAQASSKALGEFLRLCAAAGPARCALAQQPDPAAVYREVADRLRAEPLDLGSGRVLDYPIFVSATLSVLYSPRDWQAFAAELEGLYLSLTTPEAAAASSAAAVSADSGSSALSSSASRAAAIRARLWTAARAVQARGADGAPALAMPMRNADGHRLQAVERPLPAGPAIPVSPAILASRAATTAAVPADNALAVFSAVGCEDSLNPDHISHWAETAAAQDDIAAYFGRSWTWTSAACASWTLTDPHTYRGPFGRRISAPLLVVGNRFDPATPYEGAVTTASRFPGARLLTVSGYGHTSASVPSRCVDAAVAAYLVRGVLPAKGTVCRQDVVPFSR